MSNYGCHQNLISPNRELRSIKRVCMRRVKQAGQLWDLLLSAIVFQNREDSGQV